MHLNIKTATLVFETIAKFMPYATRFPYYLKIIKRQGFLQVQGVPNQLCRKVKDEFFVTHQDMFFSFF